ncbi:MAG: RHS repeat-associated core domain-containing protein [Candidatus Melainabacteria bacterium]|nr:RHS repeat-associated core domain-containing protein [Candidatus Melainabacteria bacterium]
MTAPQKPTTPQNSKPSVRKNEREQSTSHDDALPIIESRPKPSNIYKPGKSPLATSALAPIRTAVSAGFAEGALGTASLAELARALKNDVDLIFEFFNNIEFLPVFGSQKGALGTLIDGMGGSFDQSELMVELLRLAGYTASYQFGELELTLAEASAWLGTETTDINAASALVSAGRIPNSVVSGKLRMSHCFVKVNISGTDYVFDPAMKSYTTTTGINLATALSYSRTTLMSDASSGATINANYVQNINRGNVRSDLATYTANLVSYIKTNMPAATLDDIVGGRTIVPTVGPVRQTALPYLRPSTTPTTWSTDIPGSYCATFHVLYDSPNIDVTFYSKDIHGKRLTITFNGSLEAELRLDGTLIATSSAQGFGGWNSVLLEAVHPYATTDQDTSFWMTIWTDHPYLIAQAWGNAGPQMIQIHQEKLKQAKFNGASSSSEEVLGEGFASIWHGWDAQNNRATDIINRLAKSKTIYHHQVGLYGHYDTVYEDLPGIMWATAALDNDFDKVKITDNAMAMHGIAFEAAVLQQMAGVGGVSTTTLLDIANAAGDKIYDGNTANWLGTVKPALTNYSAGTLTDIENWWINNGWRVAIPEDGLQPKDDWTGYAYYAISPWQGTIGIINGNLKGGAGSVAVTLPDFEAAAGDGNQDIVKETADGHSFSGPIDLASGQFTSGSTDLTVGSQSHPYGLDFSRSYRSNQRLDDAGLGLGWSHNHQMSIQKYSDGMLAMASENPIQGAAGIVELFVVVDLYNDQTKPLDKWIVATLANQWLVDNVTDNVMQVNVVGEKKSFVLLPNGTYARPLGGASDLTDTGSGTFRLTTPQKIQYNFNADGDVATVIYPQGVTVTYAYTSGNLTSVTNGLGRTLTLAYTGSRLNSVSDGNGRSVSFTVDGSANLTQLTDANGKFTVYEYDQPGRMTKTYLPANPATALFTNVYDSLNRVKEKQDAYGNVMTFYLAGTRAEEKDAAGFSNVSYLDKNGSPVRSINKVGKETKTVYDGQSRPIKVTQPEGNYVELTYDINNNILTAKSVAKAGSGLSDITNSFTYDSNWNQVATAVDGLGRTTSYTWNATTGTLTSVQQPVIGGFTPTTSFTYNARGQKLTATDQTGIVTQINYHASLERIESIVNDQGVGRKNLTVGFGYDTVGNVTSITDPLTRVFGLSYDSLRRITQTTAPSPFGFITKFTFDDNGNTVKVEKQTSDPGAPWQTSSVTYFVDNLVQSQTNPEGKTSTVSYTNRRQAWKNTDPLSRVIELSYDSAGRKSTLKDEALATAMTFAYTDNGLIASVKDTNNNTTLLDYDGFDRLNKTTFPDTSYTQHSSYDANGNVLVFRMRSGNTVTNTFDVLNRLSTKSPTSQPVVTNTYDLAGRLIKASTPVVAGEPTSGDFQYFFDTAGRFYQEQYPDAKTVTHVLDANGNRTKTTWPDGYFIDRVFDQLNRLTDIRLNGSGSSSLHFDYDALSRRSGLTYGASVASAFYSFGTANDVTALAQSWLGSSVAFAYGYDDTGRLVNQAASDAQFAWHSVAGGTASYGAASNLNLYPTVGGVSQTYNTNGCLTSDGTWTFSYDTENHLTAASMAGVSASYLYDPAHRQGQKNVGGVRTRYIYDGWQRIADYDGTTGTLQNRFVYGTSLDEPLIQVSAAGVVSYFHHDRIGNVIATSDSTGAVTNRYKYSPYGESPSMTGNSFGFQGQRYDSETGLYYFKHRQYSSKLGRFLQPDPIGYNAGMNLYAYVGNDPLDHTDPYGLQDLTGGAFPGATGNPMLDGGFYYGGQFHGNRSNGYYPSQGRLRNLVGGISNGMDGGAADSVLEHNGIGSANSNSGDYNLGSGIGYGMQAIPVAIAATAAGMAAAAGLTGTAAVAAFVVAAAPYIAAGVAIGIITQALVSTLKGSIEWHKAQTALDKAMAEAEARNRKAEEEEEEGHGAFGSRRI